MAIRLLLVDDHKVMLQGLVSLLRGQFDLEVAGTAQRGDEAVVLAERLRPDVVVMDISLPDGTGLETTREIRHRFPDMRVLALSLHSRPRCVGAMLDGGASGYVLKDCAFEELVRAIRVVHRGETFLGSGVSLPTSAEGRSGSPRTTGFESLSVREQDVLRLVADGQTSAQVALRLGISPHTVVRHRQNIMGKLDVHSVAGLTRVAVREQLTTA